MVDEYNDQTEDIEVRVSWREKWLNWTNAPFYVMFVLYLLIVVVPSLAGVFALSAAALTIYLMRPTVKEVKRIWPEPKAQVDFIASMGTGIQLKIPAFSDIPYTDVHSRANSSLFHIDTNHFGWIYRDALGFWNLLVSRTFRDAEGPFKWPLVGVQSVETQYLEPQYLIKLAKDMIKEFEGTRRISDMMQKYGVSEGVVEQLIINWARKKRIHRVSIGSVVADTTKVSL